MALAETSEMASAQTTSFTPGQRLETMTEMKKRHALEMKHVKAEVKEAEARLK